MPRYGRRTRLNRRSRRQFPGVRRTTGMFRRRVRATVYRMSETKYNIQDVNVADVSTIPTVRTWTAGLSEGTSAFQRIGRNIKVKYLNFKLWFRLAGGGNPDSFVRVLVVYPRRGVDDQSALTDIQLITAFSRPDPRTLMILYDKWFSLGAEADTSLPQSRCIKWRKRGRYTFNFDGANAVKREPVLVLIGSLAAIDASNVSCAGYQSMSFKDM